MVVDERAAFVVSHNSVAALLGVVPTMQHEEWTSLAPSSPAPTAAAATPRPTHRGRRAVAIVVSVAALVTGTVLIVIIVTVKLSIKCTSCVQVNY
jgi:hypothetical protein